MTRRKPNRLKQRANYMYEYICSIYIYMLVYSIYVYIRTQIHVCIVIPSVILHSVRYLVITF